MENEPYLGCRDTQTEVQKAKNWNFSEVCASAAPVIWLEKPRENWVSYPIRDQDGSGECVTMTYATEMGIIFKDKYGEWMDFSSSFPYQYRKYPQYSGCSSEDIYSRFTKIGNVYESMMPSQFMNDAQAMAVPKKKYYDDVALTYKIPRIELPIDFETVASTVQVTGKGVMVWFKFSVPEWTNIPQVLPQPTTSGHSVTVIGSTLVKGKKYLIIQDSWGLKYADQGLRLISEEYFKARCFLASYLMNFQIQNNEIVQMRPSFNGSIVSAQKCLKWEGLFAANVPEIENWGNITRSACIEFQKRYNITPALGNFGPLTQEKLYYLYK